MRQRYSGIVSLAVLATLLTILAFSTSASAQQDNTTNETLSVLPMAELGNVSNATVTLYYYDQVTGEKGDMVPMPDNPQQVAWDASISAPGMYTFSKVPTGQWYYLEANNNGNKWFAVFYMKPGAGTQTANVDIPPFQPLNDSFVSVTPSPTTAPTAVPTMPANTPSPTASTPTPTPGPTGIFSIVAMMAAVLLLMKKRQ